GKIEHAATLEIDEKGVTGAAYVEELLMGAGPEREREIIDFVLDRPFIFVVYSGDGSVLFEGIVRNIE
ncbi:MAG: serpin family protein, partial [Lachnospiraceae bacterium]|nr:serpin family protein [Lachnospiraceae bacterium]